MNHKAKAKKKKSFIGCAGENWQEYFKWSADTPNTIPPVVMLPVIWSGNIFKKKFLSYGKEVRITIEEI